MSQAVEIVQQHYGSSGIVERLIAAIEARGGDRKALTAESFYPFDQLHGREIIATREHGGRLKPTSDEHVLDIGSGIGGPARYLAATYGCRVTGIDVTPEFVAAAREIAELTGLSDRCEFREGNAAAMPFAEGTFDAATCFYVGMNIADKLAVLREAHRVLKPAGRIVWSEVVTGEAGPPMYPLPWATEQSDSYVWPLTELQVAFKAAGFVVHETINETDDFLEMARKFASRPPPEPGQSERIANELVMGPTFVLRRRNFMESFVEGRLRSVVITAEAA